MSAVILLCILGMGIGGPECPFQYGSTPLRTVLTERQQPPSKPKVEVRGPNLPITGRASYYSYVVGGAAAGPRLRQALGPHWRGQKVDVCVGGTCVRVALTDWCQCYKGEKRERIIDLDERSFAALAPLWKGLVKVTIRG